MGRKKSHTQEQNAWNVNLCLLLENESNKPKLPKHDENTLARALEEIGKSSIFYEIHWIKMSNENQPQTEKSWKNTTLENRLKNIQRFPFQMWPHFSRLNKINKINLLCMFHSNFSMYAKNPRTTKLNHGILGIPGFSPLVVLYILIIVCKLKLILIYWPNKNTRKL